MERKTKVKLDNLTSKFFIFTHCEIKQFVANGELEEHAVIVCNSCDSPIIMKDSNEDWYYAGNKVF